MKKYWQQLETKVDALTLRERAIIFVVASLVLIIGFSNLLLDSQYLKQKQLSMQIEQEQGQTRTIQAQIQEKATLSRIDPDAGNRKRLQDLQKKNSEMRNALLATQKALVSPDRMSALLQDILQQKRGLRLVSVKTLPVQSLSEAILAEEAAASSKAAVPANVSEPAKQTLTATDAIYRHGVEITIEGTYPDIASYLAKLESMPWQLYWSSAKLDVEEYPRSTLKLTVFTMSLDKRWLNL